MLTRMPGPWKHPETGTYYLRERVPADLRSKAAGRSTCVSIGGSQVLVRIGKEHVKVSLRTKDPKPAKEAYKVASATLGGFWEALRKGPRRLSHKETVALAGEVYENLVSRNEDDPGTVERWVREEAANLRAEFGGSGKESLKILPETEHRRRSLEAHLGHAADKVLCRRRLLIDDDSRARLLNQTIGAVRQGNLVLMRRAEGDYGPDSKADRFGKWDESASLAPALTIASIFEGWANEVRSPERTRSRWLRHIDSFIAFLGYEDAGRVTRSDVIAWKDALLEKGKTAKTINGSQLAALKAVFRWAAENERIKQNPADGVVVKAKKRAAEKMQGFSDAEARVILEAASSEKRAPYHWIPAICATSGARVSEVAQLRGVDIKREHGVMVFSISDDAGSLKNTASFWLQTNTDSQGGNARSPSAIAVRVARCSLAGLNGPSTVRRSAGGCTITAAYPPGSLWVRK